MRFGNKLNLRNAVSMAALAVALVGTTASAQSLNWDGQTGVYVTPLAYTSGAPAGKFGKPSVGYHFLNGGDVLGKWSSVSITEGIGGRFEFGYTRNFMSAGSNAALSPLWDGGFNVVHAKGVLVPENMNKHNWVPAISAGFVARMGDKNVSGIAGGNKTYTNGDFYIVGTKIITQTKLPLIVNFGYKGTNASVLGLTGNAPEFTGRMFGGGGFVLKGPAKSTIILVTEFSQQPREIKNVPGVVIPTTIAYAARIVPMEKTKLNIDFGIAQVAGKIAPGVDVQLRSQFVAAVSYGF
ncbi:MAG: DUF3034 family protein [Bryobacteraceae bacterium]